MISKGLKIFQLIATTILAVIVINWTNSGTDYLVLTWILGAIVGFFPIVWGFSISIVVTSLVVAAVLINSSSWTWGWLDYTIVIERIISTCIAGISLWRLKKSSAAELL